MIFFTHYAIQLKDNSVLTRNISFEEKDIISFCKKWKISEFYFFGSVLTDNFIPDKSDIDIIIDFSRDTQISLFDHMDMKEELENLFQRKVDLVTKRAIENSKNIYRKTSVLESSKLYYKSL